MSKIKLTVTDPAGTDDEFYILDRKDGPEIVSKMQGLAEADRSAVVDITHVHCESCQRGTEAVDRLGILQGDVDALLEWSSANPDHDMSGPIGRVLSQLKNEIYCLPGSERLTLRVESTHG